MAEKKPAPSKKPTSANSEPIKNVAGQLRETGQKAVEAGKKALSSVGEEVVEFEKEIMQLPVDRRIIFFLGLVVLLSVFLDAFGEILLVLIGLGMIYAGYKGSDIFIRVLGSEKKKK